MRLGLALAIVLLFVAPARAEWLIKPFAALTFGGGTTLIDPEHAAGSVNPTLGVNAGFNADVIGVEGDFGYGPGFFQTGDQDLVLKSNVTTLTGNVTLSLPKRMTEYTLRPYFVGGLGLLRASTTNASSLIETSGNWLAVDIGGGVTGFLSRRLGVSWEIRHFRMVNGKEGTGQTASGREQMSFWRANMALAIRY
jgi:hypothetical protein